MDAKSQKDVTLYEPVNATAQARSFHAIMPRARSAGSRRGMPGATSIWRSPTAFSTRSPTRRRSSAFPPPPGKTAPPTSRHGEFVWNLGETMDLAQQMNATAAHVAHDVSEFKISG